MTARCPACHDRRWVHDAPCPYCTAPARSDAPAPLAATPAEPVHADEPPTVRIARFASAAEAGYFADELEGMLGVAPVLHADHNFDVIGGHWNTHFVLRVAPSAAAAAAEALQLLLGDEDPSGAQQEGEYDGDGAAGGTASDVASRVNWVPILLTLAAGSAVLWGVREWTHEQRRAAADVVRQRQLGLWLRMAGDDAPWVQRAGDGRSVRQLSIDRGGRTALFEEDANGDGIFETRRRYALTPR